MINVISSTQFFEDYKNFGYTLEFGTNSSGQPTAKAYKPKTKGKFAGMPKYRFNYRFANEDRRVAFLVSDLSGLRQRSESQKKAQAKRSEARKNFINPYKVGQIFYDSWGYDQTNIDFYEIVEVKEKSVMLRPIAGKFAKDQPTGNSSMSAMVVPDPGNYIGEPELKIIQVREHEGKVSSHFTSRHGWISEYKDGEKGTYSSWYA